MLLLLLCTGVLGGCTLGTGANGTQAQYLSEVADFAPGQSANLRMFEYIPATASANPPMVVVLHHCFQRAADYVEDAGWRTIADRYGLVLLLPQQSPLNDLMYCFSYPHQTSQTRGQGESESIHLMMEKMIREHNIDRRRIYITGLSSGGSMSLVVMATYPELFAGGGVVGAVPFACATSGIEYPACLLGADSTTPPGVLGDRVRAATSYRGPWPRLSVWHGTEDAVSRPVNGRLIVQQWLNVHGVGPNPSEVARLGEYPRELYRNASGEVAVEFISLTGIGHSVPVDAAHGCGTGHDGVGDFVSDIGLCSSEQMVQFWGLRPVVTAQIRRN